MRLARFCLILACLTTTLPSLAAPALSRLPQSPLLAAPKLAARNFRVADIAELKTAVGKAPVKVTTSARRDQMVRPSTLAAPKEVGPQPLPSYTRGKGIVLDARKPYSVETNSSVIISNVMYTDELVYLIQYGHDPIVLSQLVPNSRSEMLSASFSTLPAGPHTYTLTLGHSADPKYVSIKINDQEFGPNQLTFNAGTSEHRLTFTYDPAANGNDLNVQVYFTYPNSAPWDYQQFHHLQMAVTN